MRPSRFLPIGALLLLAACATQPAQLYVPFGQFGDYGFAEEQLSETRLRVRYEAPTRTTHDAGRIERERQAGGRVALAYDMALLRAAELALALGFPAFSVSQRQNDVAVDVDRDYPYFGDPFLFHSPFHRRRHLHRPAFYFPQSTVGAGVTLLVELKRTAGDDALDAAATATRLRAKYPTTAPAVG